MRLIYYFQGRGLRNFRWRLNNLRGGLSSFQGDWYFLRGFEIFSRVVEIFSGGVETFRSEIDNFWEFWDFFAKRVEIFLGEFVIVYGRVKLISGGDGIISVVLSFFRGIEIFLQEGRVGWDIFRVNQLFQVGGLRYSQGGLNFSGFELKVSSRDLFFFDGVEDILGELRYFQEEGVEAVSWWLGLFLLRLYLFQAV